LKAFATMRTFERATIARGAHTLDATWYTSADVYRQEREQIFARSWVCVGRLEQIERPGQYFVAHVADESLIVVKDASGAAHAFFNVCRHRGSRVCTTPTGTFKGSIQCPYHAWTYALDGSLIAARNMDNVDGFERADYPLHEAAVAELDGFLYVNFTPQPLPFERAYAALVGRFSRWRIAQLKTARIIEYDVACNWKLVFQNYSECYHCPLVHPQLDKLSPSDSGRNDLSDGPFLGGYSTLRDPGGSLTTTGRSGRAPIGDLGGDELGRVYYYTIFPSLLLSLHPDYVMVHYVRPTAVNRTSIACAWLFDPSAMQAPDFDPSDAVDFWDVTNRQDWRVNELTQLGVSSRAYTPGPYSQQEGLLHAFDRHYLSSMAQ